MQANYAVHADDSGGDAQMRDSVRFHFGFTVPYIGASRRRRGDRRSRRLTRRSRRIARFGRAADGAWWMRLVGESAPKIIARLPFVERPNHPAGLPVFVVARLAPEAMARGVTLYAVGLARWTACAARRRFRR